MRNCDVKITSDYGWVHFDEYWGSVWVKGYIFDQPQPQVFAEKLMQLVETANEAGIKKYLANLDGHFAIVLKTPEVLFAAVDRIRSIPLFFANYSDHIILTDQPTKLDCKLRDFESSPGSEDRLMLQMSGYCSGSVTLLTGVKQLQSGEYLKVTGESESEVISYYKYNPVNPAVITEKVKLKKSLETATKRILQKIIDSADGRTIVVPLSGGYDSRLVASGFFHLGYKNVKCFSYGQKNNFESLISRKVAEKLGYEWKFIKLTHGIVRADYHSELHDSYFSFSNTFSSVPVEHEFTAVRLLKESGWISDDAIFVNGMSGDFLTGSHIPKTLQGDRDDLNKQERKDLILSALIDKHYSLWTHLKTPKNNKLVANYLWNEIVEEVNGLPENSFDDFGLYEFSEFKNRQTKYVITVQRVYEFFGYEWRLPLWDKEYLDYWENIKMTHKVNRNLFIEVMYDLNWGGVWNLKLPSPYITPKWISMIRVITKSLFVFIGRDNWKKFDKKVFHYWTEILCKTGVVSYSKVLLDSRGYRNAVSWLTEDYLDRIQTGDRSKNSIADE